MDFLTTYRQRAQRAVKVDPRRGPELKSQQAHMEVQTVRSYRKLVRVEVSCVQRIAMYQHGSLGANALKNATVV